MEVNTEVCDWLMSNEGIMWQRGHFSPVQHATNDGDMPGKSPVTMFMSAKFIGGFYWGPAMCYIADEREAAAYITDFFNYDDDGEKDVVYDLAEMRDTAHP